jgi:group I intron endonuclease
MNIYAITNDVNDKVYVGTTAQPLARRWNGHLQQAKHGRGYSLASAMREFGANKFHVTSVWSGYVSRDALHGLEKYFIKSFRTKSPNGYNETTGGWSRVYRPCSPEKAAKISAKLMGHTVSEETKEKIRNSPCAVSFVGRTHTPEVMERIAAAHRGRKASDETRKRQSDARKGKVPWNKGRRKAQ